MSTRNDCTVGADTTASGSEFQMRTIRHAKKWFRMLHLASGISRPEVGLDLEDLL
jgi:hypothetical protein